MKASKVYYFRKCWFGVGRYGFTVINFDHTFVSRSYITPLEALNSLKKYLNESK